METVRSAWAEHKVGSPMFKLMKKLKHTKARLKEWNKTQVGNIQSQVSQTSAVQDDIQTRLQVRSLELNIICEEKAAIKKHAKASIAEKSSQKQKCRNLGITLETRTQATSTIIQSQKDCKQDNMP